MSIEWSKLSICEKFQSIPEIKWIILSIIVTILSFLAICFSIVDFGLESSLVNGSIALGLAIMLGGFTLFVTQINSINMKEVKEQLDRIERHTNTLPVAETIVMEGKSVSGKNDAPSPEQSSNSKDAISFGKKRDLRNIVIGALFAILGNFWITSLKEITPSVQWGNPIILFVTTLCFWGLVFYIICEIFKQ